jgi:hypothetical protein
MRPEDVGEAWALAYERARHQGAEDQREYALVTGLPRLPVQKEDPPID